MIVVDSSALMEILLHQPARDTCIDALDRVADRYMSAGTLTEALIVAEGKSVGRQMLALVDAIKPTVVPVTEQTAREAMLAFRQWGKGRHPAGLNYGDCFSYVASKQLRCPLLFIGDDFSQTDIRPAL